MQRVLRSSNASLLGRRLPSLVGHQLARSMAVYTHGDIQIKKVGMVGLGLMGHGIAQTVATAGFEVVGVEMNDKAIEVGMGRIQKSLTKLAARQVQKGKLQQDQADQNVKKTLGLIHATTDLNDLKDCDLVIEAIVENLDVKKQFYGKIGKIVKPSAIFASNTSSLPITDFAGSSGRADQMVGIHFFNPVQIMKLVEVVQTDSTDPAVMDACKGFISKIGKVPVSCKDTPGFIVNRLLVPYLGQAIAMYERGDASKEDIDVSMQLGAGHPMGPLTLSDYVGLDTTLYILEGWVKKYPNEPAFFVPEVLRQKVAEGKLGRKTGEGFFKWDGDKRL